MSSSNCLSGNSCAMVGDIVPTNGDSSIRQTFTVTGGNNQLSFWYKMTCPDTIAYDWATATLLDNTLGTSLSIFKTCPGTAGMSWTQATASVISGHSYTLTLTSHDDNFSSDPSYTLFDDIAVTLVGTPTNQPIAIASSPSASPIFPTNQPIAITPSVAPVFPTNLPITNTPTQKPITKAPSASPIMPTSQPIASISTATPILPTVY